jgi:EAL domain-containing protein (putative c-di-GMP-specific phosphodiesterase class I)/GGDEF domain-containing protein
VFGTTAGERLLRAQRVLRRALTRVEVLAVFPVLVLLAQEFGGPRAVVGTAMILPALLVLLNLGISAGAETPSSDIHRRWQTGDGRQTMLDMLERVAGMPATHGACFLLELDDWQVFGQQWGAETSADVLDRVRDRLRAALRDTDHLAYLGAGRFGVVAYALSSGRLGARNGIANRLQACVSEPLRLGETSVRLSVSLGHARLSREAVDPAGQALDAAGMALSAAQTAGPGSVRAHWEGMTPGPAVHRQTAGAMDRHLAGEVREALETGAIQPWFLPQIDAKTGGVTGFEILSRWDHPTHGLLTPSRFAESLAEAGQIDIVAAHLRERALDALGEWDRSGAGIPELSISMRIDTDALRNPSLAEQIAWALDTADIAPHRLSLAIPEPASDVSGDDAVVDTLEALRQQGVRLELEDFGTGQTSLLSIRRFGITRIRIERSLIVGLDQDAEQKAMVGGILSLAREMRLGTLAEGVDTAEEHATLADMGCDALQGRAVGNPMPFVEARDWLARRMAPAVGPGTDLPQNRA